MKAIILAGGLGERLKPFTQAIPKPLLPIGEQSLLEIQIQNLAKYGFDQIFIATNYKSNYIENFIGDGHQFGIRIRYSRETQPLGTCGPLSLLRTALDEDFVMMNGDILTTIDFRRFYEFGRSQDSDLTIATKNIVMPFNFGKVHTDGNRIVKVEEKPDVFTEVVAGIYFMRHAILNLVPDGKYFGIDNLIARMLADGRPITRYAMDEYWLDIGQINDYSEAEEAYRTHFDKK
jgi:NDP-sugar pyrophosphorylase family protein